MRRLQIHSILFLLCSLAGKVIVIDDVGATKEFGEDKKALVEKVKKKINNGDEEVVIYGKNKRNRNVRISSDEFNQKAKAKKEKELEKKIEKLNNQKIINSLRKLVAADKETPRRKHYIQPPARNKRNRETTKNKEYLQPNTNDNKIEIDEPLIDKQPSLSRENSVLNRDSGPRPSIFQQKQYDSYQDLHTAPYQDLHTAPYQDLHTAPYQDLPTAPYQDLPTAPKFPSLYDTKSPLDDDFTDPYSPQNNDNFKLDEDPFNIISDSPTPYDAKNYDKLPLSYTNYESSNSVNNANISVLKSQEKEHLLRAINNRKEYIRIKLDEVHSKKENIVRQIGDYKQKIEEIYNRINKARSTRDNLYTKMNMEKSHINNLEQNAKDIQEKEGKLKALIRVTRNEIIRYKSLLENEMSKIEVLEKQYAVYEDTLRRYNDDSNQESNNLVKYKNDLSKYENDLKDLTNIFSAYKNKHNELNEELNRQTRIESNLEMEENKINRNGLSDIV